MGPILRAVGSGYTTRTILRSLARGNPQLANAIYSAEAAGYASHTIARLVDKKSRKKGQEDVDDDDYLTEHERVQKRDEQDKKRALLTAVGALGTAGAIAAGGYAYATRNNAIYPNQILPPLPQGPNQPPGLPGGQQLGLPGPQNVGPRGPNQPPGNPNNSGGSGGPNVIIPPYTHNPQKNVSLIKNLKEDNRIASIISSGLAMPAILQAIRETIPKGKLNLLDKAEGGFEQAIQDFAQDYELKQSEEKRIETLQKFNEKSQKQSLLDTEEQRFENEYGHSVKPPMPQKPNPGLSPIDDEEEIIEGLQNTSQNMQNQQVAQQSQMPQEIDPQQQLQSPTESPFEDENGIREIADQHEQLLQDLKKETQNNLSKQQQEKALEQIRRSEDFLRQHRPQSKALWIPNLEKGIVVTPQGAGTITHDGKKGVIADVDGKKKSFEKADVEKPTEDVIEAVQNILNIPEVDRSSNIALFLYNPKDKEMYFQFHNGESYKYYDIDPDKVFRLANKMAIPITEGQNVFGAWSQEDRNSLGAAFYQEILKDPKYKKSTKGEPQNPNYQKLETMYDYWKQLRKQPKRKASEKPTEKEPEKQVVKRKPQPLRKGLSEEEVIDLIDRGMLKSQQGQRANSSKLPELKKVKRPDVSAKGLREQKDYILEKIEDAIKNPKKETKLEIDVPGDGIFRINNNGDALTKFRDKIKKAWPVKQLPEPKIKKTPGYL